MKKVKHIFTIFLHSFIPQDIYYPKLLHTRFSFSVKYYLVIISFFALTFAGIALYRFSPAQMVSYKNSVINSLSSFPEDATIKIKNGTLDLNQNKPLFLWIYNDNQPLFVVMVYTEGALTNSHIPTPLVFLGNDKMQISYRGTTIIRSYDKSLDITVSKDKLQSLITLINSWFPPFILLFYLFLIVALPLLSALMLTIFIGISSLLVYIVFQTFIPHAHLKKCIQAGMHGTHIPLFIVMFLFLLFPSAGNILVVAASLIFVFTLVSTYEMYSKDVVHFKGR